MPELPEVETIAHQLREYVRGAVINHVELYREDYLRGQAKEDFIKGVEGRSLKNIFRRGKFLIFHLDDGFILAHLGMTGKFIAADPRSQPPKHTIARFSMQSTGLLLVDPRRFGRLNYYQEDEIPPTLQNLGIEPLSPEFTPEYLYERFKSRLRPVKELLLDQNIIAGLGNIYVNEILFRAGVHPSIKGGDVSAQKLYQIAEYTKIVLNEAIENNGTTISDYRNVDDKSGGFQDFLQVYGKAGEKCPKCGSTIERMVSGGRSSFFCPECQIVK